MKIPLLLTHPLQTWTGRLLAAALVGAVLVAGVSGAWLWTLIHPQRRGESTTPAGLLVSYDEVTFSAVDGVPLSGWFVAGDSPRTIVLCHDRGEDRSVLINTAIPLHRGGWSLFLLDFRGHGKSGGTCALGQTEKRDILGALDYLATRKDVNARSLGLLGVGMGAYAGVLAARERPEIVALALDSPYPDVRTLLARAIPASPSWQHWLAMPPAMLFDLRFRASDREESAAAALPALSDRDILFIVAQGAPDAPAVHELYARSPEGRLGDKNLLELPGSRLGGLYGDQKQAYDRAVLNFFTRYLPSAPRDAAPSEPKQARRAS